jgi:hypothetical protein
VPRFDHPGPEPGRVLFEPIQEWYCEKKGKKITFLQPEVDVSRYCVRGTVVRRFDPGLGEEDPRKRWEIRFESWMLLPSDDDSAGGAVNKQTVGVFFSWGGHADDDLG